MVTRRRLLRMLAGVFATGACVSAPVAASSAAAVMSGSGLRTRRRLDVASNDGDLSAFLSAFNLLSGPASPGNPLPLSAFALRHRTCLHGSALFFPWHRAFLASFEGACARVLEAADHQGTFALPYWDWCDLKLGLPQALLDMNSTCNRKPTMLKELSELVPSSREHDPAQYFHGVLPGSPGGDGGGSVERFHNYVHEAIGLTMLSSTAPLDPLFWLLHANVDRLWAKWNKENGSSAGVYKEVAEKSIGDFYLQPGKYSPVSVNETMTMGRFGYCYDDVDDTQGVPKFAPLSLTPSVAVQGGATKSGAVNALLKLFDMNSSASTAHSWTVNLDAFRTRLDHFWHGDENSGPSFALALTVQVSEVVLGGVKVVLGIVPSEIEVSEVYEQTLDVWTFFMLRARGPSCGQGGSLIATGQGGQDSQLFSIDRCLRQFGRERLNRPGTSLRVRLELAIPVQGASEFPVELIAVSALAYDRG